MHLGRLLARLARRHGDRIALRDAKGDWSFACFGARLARLGHALRGLGLGRGDRVALLLPDIREYLECDYGCMAAGLVRVPLDPRLPPGDLVALLRHAGARALLTHAELAPPLALLRDALPELAHVVSVGGPLPGAVAYESLLASAIDAPFEDGDAADLATLNFSGGTTGRPKAIMLRHRNLAAVLQNTIAGFDARPEDVFLNLRPLWPIAQLVMFAHLAAGATVVLGGRFIPEAFAAQVDSSGATRTSLVPTQLVRALPHMTTADPRLARLTAVILGGSRLPPADFATALAVCGPRLGVLYGMTEAPVSTYLPPAALRDEAAMASVGHALFSTELRIGGPGGAALPPSEEGEVMIRGPHVMAGYWNDPAASGAALADGWLHTGDLGRLDATGLLSITGRLKEVIRSGATSIVPAEVEDALASHPDVAEVAVAGMPDREWGEAVTAFVVLRPGATPDAAALVAHCRAVLAAHKKPRRVCFVEAIPRSHYGKVLKPQLLALAGDA
ncbi:class I adenylate-forming enzyme family protein [Humitalea sp. 24SJ18S-53]|uniref:class I adenylate-forming enzyme family protein n=1 Tax=Humitalea sp. 24SJ18S-53 TaxID=3422307 RepID=UPI003D67F3B4